jgi:hypothetical protein
MSQRTWRRIRSCVQHQVCTYGLTGHVTKAYVSDSNQIMVAYWSVYGDFSPILYNSHFIQRRCVVRLGYYLISISWEDLTQQSATGKS